MQQVPKVEVPQVQVRIGIWVRANGIRGEWREGWSWMRNTFAGVINQGNPANFESWMFDLITAVGSVDQSLARDLKVQLKVGPKVEVIDCKFDIFFEIELDNHAKHKR